jgi:uncharacterized membrane-anchored protein
MSKPDPAELARLDALAERGEAILEELGEDVARAIVEAMLADPELAGRALEGLELAARRRAARAH